MDNEKFATIFKKLVCRIHKYIHFQKYILRTLREEIFAHLFRRHFVGINFRELGLTKDFAGINFREGDL